MLVRTASFVLPVCTAPWRMHSSKLLTAVSWSTGAVTSLFRQDPASTAEMNSGLRVRSYLFHLLLSCLSLCLVSLLSFSSYFVSFYLFLNVVSVAKPSYTLYRASSPGSDVQHDVIINMFLDSILNTRNCRTGDLEQAGHFFSKVDMRSKTFITESDNSLIYLGYYLIS